MLTSFSDFPNTKHGTSSERAENKQKPLIMVTSNVTIR